MIAVISAAVLALALAEAFLRAGRVALRLVPGAGGGPWRPLLRLITGCCPQYMEPWFTNSPALMGTTESKKEYSSASN